VRPTAYPKIETARVVVLMTPEQVAKVDAWGARKGKLNRTETIRSLLDRALEAERNERA
jgi:hypothetical protein